MVSRIPNFDYMKHRGTAIVVSGVLSLVCLFFLLGRGLNLGVDFTGGIVVNVQYSRPAELDKVRARLAAAGFESVQAQNVGSSSRVQIRLPPDPSGTVTAVSDVVLGVLRADDPEITSLGSSSVGSQVGEDLFENAGLALLLAMIMMFAYVSLRFRWKFALAASIAEIHDVLLTIGLFSLTGWSFDLTVLGAALAVLGYSINDKIVVFDRVRDNLRLMRHGTTEAIVNASVNQVLSRTLVTGVTTLLVLIALLVVAGEMLFGFAIALIVGILVGTYSSIFVAASVVVMLKVRPSDMVSAKKRLHDGMP